MKKQTQQTGASLLTGLVFLLVVSLLGVSSVRLSIIDTMIASNEEQQMLVRQSSETAKKEYVKFYNVYQWLDNGQKPQAITKTARSTQIKTSVEIDAGEYYPCFGQNGEAMSLGPAAPRCRVFYFDIKSQIPGTGASQTLTKGEGKEFPNVHGHSF